MTLNGSHSEAEESRTLDTSSIMASTMLTSSQDSEIHDGNGISGGLDTIAIDDAKSAAQYAKLVDDFETLKKKILELEQQTKIASATNTEQENLSADRRAEREDYKRMEECLYRHRKEWEVEGGSTGWNMWTFSDYFSDGRVSRRWELNNNELYERPNPFNPSHDCRDKKDDKNARAYAEFDRDIDYGHRRERLRKNFEWDMDRLYLAEEAEKRRKFKEEEAKEDAEKEAETDITTQQIFAEPKNNRLGWSAFRDMELVAEENSYALDILIGDPIIDDDARDYRRWYGYSGQRSRKTEIARDRKVYETNENGQVALPERIRVHSTILRHILSNILASHAGEALTNSGYPSIVFVRPFKAIFYCKAALLNL
ncbi:hypothetical protein TrVGV298_000144 [Trichoderma virens]|nr:hypothetical protein TrVGV298_000144 [Trichoderma virens]